VDSIKKIVKDIRNPAVRKASYDAETVKDKYLTGRQERNSGREGASHAQLIASGKKTAQRVSLRTAAIKRVKVVSIGTRIAGRMGWCCAPTPHFRVGGKVHVSRLNISI